MYVVTCETCGYHQEWGHPHVANDDAREHRARSRIIPTAKPHKVVAMPKGTFEEAKRKKEREAELQQERRDLAAVVATTRPSVAASPAAGAYATWVTFYQGFGFRVTPVHKPCPACRKKPDKASDCEGCRGGKKPLFMDWQSGGVLVAEENVGLVMGEASGGGVVLDFDTTEGVRRLFNVPPELLAMRTLVVRTGRGYHVYLLAPGFGRSRHVMGILVRADRGLVVVPPSMHATGKRYEFVSGAAVADRVIARASDLLPPDFLRSFLEPPSSGDNTNVNTNGGNTNNATRAPARASGAAVTLLRETDLGAVEAWVNRQWPALLRHWDIVQARAPPLDKAQGGRSKSDWVVGLCLAEMGLSAEEIGWVLYRSPGSKAADPSLDEDTRVTYALLTARKAADVKARQRASLQGEGTRASA